MRPRPLYAIAALIIAAPILWPASADAGSGPTIAYWGGSGRPGARIAASDGTVLATVHGVDWPYFSLNAGVFTSTRNVDAFRENVLGVDATSGVRLFTVKDAHLSLLTPGAAGLVFTPDREGAGGPSERDPTINSVWYRDLTTSAERRLVQFHQPERSPIQLAAAPKRPLVAVTEGNDADLLGFDLWVLRTDRLLHRRLTDDGNSLYPSFSPSGRTIAYTWQDDADSCGSQIRLIHPDGSGRRVLATSSCSRRLLRPIWIDSRTLVAWSWNRHGPTGLVRVDARTGVVSRILRGAMYDYDVSRGRHQVVARLVNFTMRLIDGGSWTVSKIPGGRAYRSDIATITGALEQSN